MDISPDIDSVELSVHAALEGRDGVLLEREGDRIRILSELDNEAVGYIEITNGQPTIYTIPWHGRFESAEHLATTLVLMLGGYARPMAEYKGEKFTIGLLTTYVTGGWTMNWPSFYVNPFLKTEWLLAEGEQWEIREESLHLIDASDVFLKYFPDAALDERKLPPGFTPGKHSKFREDSLIHYLDEGYVWFEKRYGDPLPEMKWASDSTWRFVYQVPDNWIDQEFEGQEWISGFKEPESDWLILVQVELVDSSPHGSEQPATYESIKFIDREATRFGVACREFIWCMKFDSGDEKLHSWYTLRWPLAASDSSKLLVLKAHIEESLKLAVFCPGRHSS